MSKTYEKEISITQSITFIKCDKCGIETLFSLAIDNWCIIDDENYCRNCQKNNNIGWYTSKK